MRHDGLMEGAGFRIRRVGDDGAILIVALRTAPHFMRYLAKLSINRNSQPKWLDFFCGKQSDYNFMNERVAGGGAQGTIGLFDIRGEAGEAEWGHWLIKPGSLAAVERALLIYWFGLKVLELGCTYADTAPVVLLPGRTGAQCRAVLDGYFSRDGQAIGAIKHVIEAVAAEPALGLFAARTARLPARGAAT